MNLVVKILSVFIIVFTIFSCSSKNSVSIRSFSPQDEVNKLTTFTIEFDEPLAPNDKQNIWLDDQFIEFVPEIEGKFKWTDSRTLIFSPDNPLEPIQEYKANITNKVLFNTTFDPDFEIYTFNTPDFNVTKTDFFWTQIAGKQNIVSIQANIYFNYNVNPDQLQKHLKILVNDQSITDWKIISESSSNIIAINLGEVKKTESEQEIEIEILQGLESIIGKKPLEDTRSFTQTLEPITRLAIKDVTSGFDGTTGWIIITTTQRVDEKKLKDFVKITPKTKLHFFSTSNQIRIEGDFQNYNSVNLLVKKGLPGLYGGELEFEFEQAVSLVSLEPDINFTNKQGRYLLLGGEENISADIINVDEIEIEVEKIFSNNIVRFLYENSYSYYDNSYSYKPYYNTYGLGKTIYTKKQKLGNKNNWLNKVNINLNEAIGGRFNGIFLVTARSNTDRWRRDSKIIAISDLGIIVKKSNNGLIVFVNSISKAEQQAGVKVDLLSSNNQVLLTGITDKNGVVKFSNINNQVYGFTPKLITVSTESDFNYLDLRETLVETSRYEVGGVYNNSEFNTFVYSERNLYRPGEKVNLSAIVRTNNYQVVTDIPVIIKVLSPTGKTFGEYKKILNRQGSFELQFSLPDYTQTGEYHVEVNSGSQQLIGSYNFSVEDFVPDKIRLTLNCDTKKAEPGDKVSTDVTAEYLFGGVAKDLKYQADVQLRNKKFISKKYPKFNFKNSSVNTRSFPNQLLDGTLDSEGKTNLEYVVPNDLVSGGIITANKFVSVFDPTGRTVNRRVSFDIYPKDYFIGINAPGYYFSTNSNLKFQFIAVDKNDKPKNNFEAIIKLVRFEWQTVLKKDNSNRYFYQSEKQEKVEWEKQVTLTGKPEDINFNLSSSGSYELRISKSGETQYQTKSFYAYRWGRTTASSFEVDKEGRIDIVFDKETYKPGEKAKILFKAPFAGKMLVTFERDSVYNYQYLELNERSTQLEVQIPENYLPNIYVSATLFRPHSNEATSPFLVGHGYNSMKVEEPDYLIPITIEAPEKIKPNRKQKVTIKTEANKDIFITLAAVDEGILQIKNYKSPNPYEYMYSKRALQVKGYDLYKLLLPEIKNSSSSTGGDALAAEMQKRTNPIKSNRFKLVSLWSGIRTPNSNGEVTVTLDIPQFNGELRLMAVAYEANRFGSGEQKMKVADDLILQPQIPRFLAPNDSLIIPVTVMNTTEKNGSVEIEIKTEGPIEIVSKISQEISCNAKGSEKVIFIVKTNNEVGKGKILFNTKGLAQVKEDYEIAVRPTSPLAVETGTGSIKGSQKIDIPLSKNFLAGTENTTITLSSFPALKFADRLKNLVAYPYGCIEQTVSKLFPQLYFEDIAKLVAPDLYKTNNPVYFVKEGIRKIESMQRYNGSMSYWQGGHYSSWWGSVYAAHFLLEAKAAGYNVNKQVLSKLLGYIEKKASSKETYDYRHYSGNKRTITKIAKKEIPYSLYVLAIAGMGDLSSMNYYKARPHLLSKDAVYLLAGAYAIMGKWNSANELLPNKFTPEKADRMTGDNFDSEIRANAIMLNVLLQIDPSNIQIPYLTKYLANNTNVRYYSTQDNAWSFVALGKAARKNAEKDLEVNIVADGEVIKSYTGKDISLSFSGNEFSEVVLESNGDGEIFYFWETEGIRIKGDLKEEDSFMKVRRTYYDYETREIISNNKFKQGQLIVCKLSLTGMSRSAENIVIADLLPSGFEIDNPRLAASTDLNWKINNPMQIDYVDIRDDRLLLFTSLISNKTSEYLYLIRVVNQGEFTLPVLGAEAMYDREIHSYHGKGKIVVEEF